MRSLSSKSPWLLKQETLREKSKQYWTLFGACLKSTVQDNRDKLVEIFIGDCGPAEVHDFSFVFSP